MMRGRIKSLTLLIVTVVMASIPLKAFGSDIVPDPEITNREPKIVFSSSSTVDVSAGNSYEIVVEVKNVGMGTAENLFVQIVPGAEDPFTASVSSIGGSTTVQAGASRNLMLKLTVDKDAKEKVYPVNLTISYMNRYSGNFSSEGTVNIRVKNSSDAERIRLYDFVMEPASLKAGETGVLSFTYMNTGSADLRMVRLSLDGLDPSKITVPEGLSFLELPIVRPYTVEKASFTVKAAPALKSGSYPITIKAIIKNSAGEELENPYEYYINVGGASELGQAYFDVLSQTAPQSAFGVGEKFTISFELANASPFDASNVLVKANPVEEGAIVPTSQSVFATREFKAGQQKKFSFTFAATSKAKSQNYPISFDIEYDAIAASESEETAKMKFSQFFGVSISNPQAEEEQDEEDNKNIPKIIVNSYSCDPMIVKAGSEFDLDMSFMNTHSEKPVKNIKISLTVTDKDDKVGASIFSPVNASNTLYIDQIQPKQTASRSIRYYAIPNANAQTYSINVNFQYEDGEGREITTQEIVGINVSQPPSIETAEITVPEMTEVGVPIFVSFQVYNTGNAAVNNLKAVLEGDMEADGGKTIWIGNFEKGSNEYIEASFYYAESGQKTGRIVVSYDSLTGEHFEIPTDFSVMVNEPMPMDPGMFPMEPEPEPSPLDWFKSNFKLLAIMAVLAGVGGGGGYWFIKRRKKQAGDDFYE